MEIDGLKEATIMLLNDMICADLNGEICFRKDNGNILILGTFNFKAEYSHVTIDLGVCRIEYEFHTNEMCREYVGMTQHMYWFKSQYVCDRYHGQLSRDDGWVTKLFEEVSPFTEDINHLLEEFFRKAFDRAQNMPGKQSA